MWRWRFSGCFVHKILPNILALSAPPRDFLHAVSIVSYI